MLIKKYFLLLIFLFFFLLINTFPDINMAREAYNNGNTIESLKLYDQWLQLNHDSKDFTSILFELAELNGDIFLISNILDEQIKFVFSREKKKDLYKYLAQLYELSSNLHNAQINYQNAALSLLNEIDYEMLLNSAKMLLLEGDLFLAESQLKEILSNSTDNNILLEAELFYTILNILHFQNSTNIINTTIETPESMYISYLIAKANSEPLKMDSIKEQLLKDFESSPEAALIRKKIYELPDVLTSLGLLQTTEETTLSINTEDKIEYEQKQNFMIQVGSFKDKENAHYLSMDLSAAGFSAVVEEQIINNIKYNKVLLYFSTEEQMSNTLRDLKEKGFEGFPVY